jgi:hypothetical protein
MRKLFLITNFLFLFWAWSCSKKETEITPEKNENITSFIFYTSANPNLPQEIKCEIINDSIIATTFLGVNTKALVPSFTTDAQEVTVNDKIQKPDITPQDFTKIVTYKVKNSDGIFKEYHVKFKDTGLPVLEIDTKNVAIQSKTNYIEGAIKVKQKNKLDSIYLGPIEIRGRGNSTWTLAKKPYKIKLAKKAKLLGMSEAKQWVLLANHSDKTLLRNELGFEISRRLGLAYTPASRLVEVILNGNYIGHYQLVEQIDVDKNKIDISQQKKGDTDISGGYLIEADGFSTSESINFRTNYRMPISVHYPEDEDITAPQISYIRNHLNKFEEALFNNDSEAPTNNYLNYFDVDSYINFYLANEIIGNPDMFWSTYFYKKKADDKLYAGPVWDFDIAANNDFRQGDTQNRLMADVAFEPRIWIIQLMKDQAFRKKIRTRWNEIKGEKLNTLERYIEQRAAEINASQRKNFAKWPILTEKIYNNYQVAGSYSAEVAYLKTYIKNRIIWLDGQFNSSRFE